MSVFVDRHNELAALEDEFKKGRPSMFVVYGRRRIGKTLLIQKFLEGKNAVYYLATLESPRSQLDSLSRAVGLAIHDDDLARFGVTGWDALAARIRASKSDKKLVLVIDEFQNLCRSERTFPSIMQKMWDVFLSEANVMLVLSGSSISMMHDEVLNYSAPLYGRASRILKLSGIPFHYACQMVPKMGFRDKLLLYLIFGGVPAYYLEMAEEKDVRGALMRIMDPASMYVGEPSLLLSEEVRRDRRYIEIMSLIADGITRSNEISTKLGMAPSNFRKYVSFLESLEMVEKEFPIGVRAARTSKGGAYAISDPFTLFWFQQIKRNLPAAEAGSVRAAVDRILSELDIFASKQFERFCARLLLSNYEKFKVQRIGRWWGTDPRTRVEEEIDIVATDEPGNHVLFGECKWTNGETDIDVLSALKRKAALVKIGGPGRKEQFVIFSKGGFTKRLKDASKNGDVQLFDLEGIERASAQ